MARRDRPYSDRSASDDGAPTGRASAPRGRHELEDLRQNYSVLATRIFDNEEIKEAQRAARQQARKRRDASESPSRARPGGLVREATAPMEIPSVSGGASGAETRWGGGRAPGDRVAEASPRAPWEPARPAPPASDRESGGVQGRRDGRGSPAQDDRDARQARPRPADSRRRQERERERDREPAPRRGVVETPQKGNAPRRSARRPVQSVLDEPTTGAEGGRVALFFSCHGGSGSTIIVTSAAALLARSGLEVCILDLDLQFGDVLTTLNMEPDYSLAEAIEDLARDDISEVYERLPRHGSGLRVLAQSGRIDGLSRVEAAPLAELLAALVGCCDAVLVDGVRDFNDFALGVLDLADEVILVATQDVPTVRGLAMRLDVFEQLGYAADELVVVVNRHGKRSPVSLDALRELLEVRPAFVIANDFRRVHHAANLGAPLGDCEPQARVTRDIAALTEAVFGVPLGEGRPKGVWARLFAR